MRLSFVSVLLLLAWQGNLVDARAPTLREPGKCFAGRNCMGPEKEIQVGRNRRGKARDFITCVCIGGKSFEYTVGNMVFCANINGLIARGGRIFVDGTWKKTGTLTRRALTGSVERNLLTGSVERNLQEAETAFELEDDGHCAVEEFDEPHLKTWDGEFYDYQGECDSVFMDAPDFGNGCGLLIQTRTTLRYDYSYIETAAIRIGDEIFEVSSFGQFTLNGVDSAEMPGKLFGYNVTHEQVSKKKHLFTVDLEEALVTFRVFKDIVSVKVGTKVVGPYSDKFLKWFSTSKGLMGEFATGDWLARDGTTILTDPNAMGEEWQVRDSEPMLFQTIRAPQYPQKCEYPTNVMTEEGRRLGGSISRAEAEKACAQWGEKKEFCVNDVMVMDDLEMAEAGP